MTKCAENLKEMEEICLWSPSIINGMVRVAATAATGDFSCELRGRPLCGLMTSSSYIWYTASILVNSVSCQYCQFSNSALFTKKYKQAQVHFSYSHISSITFTDSPGNEVFFFPLQGFIPVDTLFTLSNVMVGIKIELDLRLLSIRELMIDSLMMSQLDMSISFLTQPIERDDRVFIAQALPRCLLWHWNWRVPGGGLFLCQSSHRASAIYQTL